MAKPSTLLMIFPALILLLVGAIFAVPADAQSANIKEGCVLSDNLDIEIPFQDSRYKSVAIIKKGSAISQQIKEGEVSGGGVEIKLRQTNNDLSSTFLPIKSILDNELRTKVKTAIENKWGIICLVNTINSATGWIFFVLMAVSLVLVLVAAFFWVTSGTNSENRKKAGQMILAALVGIAIAIMSRIIPGIVIGILS